ncbi:MAG TPA: HD domain-containing phosphohydrolase, partial [Vicinamibacteria bacterium]|nr:HD domain-containing phosphohydrolase [Vicinamibacteria bacterium]
GRAGPRWPAPSKWCYACRRTGMANVIVWGKTREVLSGDLPLGLAAEEVDTLANLQAHLGPASVILTDQEHLERERAALDLWVKAGGTRRALLLAVCDHAHADELVHRFPHLDDVLIKPVSAARLRLRVDRALETLNSRRAIQQLDEALGRKTGELHDLNRIGVALSAQRNIRALLEMILSQSREITSADAGSLYLVERGKDHDTHKDDRLRFKLPQNDSVSVPFEEFTMPLDETTIAGYAALTGQLVNVADAYNLPAGSPFRYGRSFDEQSGYRTKSILTVPMRDHNDEVIGVVQLINKKRDPKAVLRPISLVEELVIPFTAVDEDLVKSLASQAAVAFENTMLIEEIRNLFNSFVQASVTAIESRDPTTSGHSGRVAILTVGLAEVVDGIGAGPFRNVAFTRDQLQEIRYASLLHDFGKVGVREKVLIKGKKLYVGELMLIRQRFAFIKRSLEAEHLRAKLEQSLRGLATPELMAQMDRDQEARVAELDEHLRMILQANEPSILEEESFRTLLDLTSRTFTDIEGNLQPYLTANEVSALSIRRGSLSEKERREIESHVTHTFRFLSEIPWTREYRKVPDIAYAHHEKLDGTGYPRKLAGGDIPIQSRMMTISDIFDALVAWDRPYKKSVPVQKALDILDEECRAGKLDRPLLDVFVQAKVYERTLPRAGSPPLEAVR